MGTTSSQTLDTASKRARKCQDILDQLEIFERSYAYSRHGASAYTNIETTTAPFASRVVRHPVEDLVAAQTKLPYKERVKDFSPAALLPLFERADSRNPSAYARTAQTTAGTAQTAAAPFGAGQI
jgi:hypothetical protein